MRAVKRWGHGCNYRHNEHFYSAIKKYGWENFTHEVLFENLDKKSAEEKEVELIALYKSNEKGYGYNLTSGGESGTHPSEETRQKLSEAHKGKKTGACSEERKRNISQARLGKKHPHKGVPRSAECVAKIIAKNQKAVFQYTKSGDFVAEYESGAKASKATGISAQGISKSCTSKRTTAGGYVWKFKNKNN